MENPVAQNPGRNALSMFIRIKMLATFLAESLDYKEGHLVELDQPEAGECLYLIPRESGNQGLHRDLMVRLPGVTRVLSLPRLFLTPSGNILLQQSDIDASIEEKKLSMAAALGWLLNMGYTTGDRGPGEEHEKGEKHTPWGYGHPGSITRLFSIYFATFLGSMLGAYGVYPSNKKDIWLNKLSRVITLAWPLENYRRLVTIIMPSGAVNCGYQLGAVSAAIGRLCNLGVCHSVCKLGYEPREPGFGLELTDREVSPFVTPKHAHVFHHYWRVGDKLEWEQRPQETDTIREGMELGHRVPVGEIPYINDLPLWTYDKLDNPFFDPACVSGDEWDDGEEYFVESRDVKCEHEYFIPNERIGRRAHFSRYQAWPVTIDVGHGSAVDTHIAIGTRLHLEGCCLTQADFRQEHVPLEDKLMKIGVAICGWCLLAIRTQLSAGRVVHVSQSLGFVTNSIILYGRGCVSAQRLLCDCTTGHGAAEGLVLSE